MGLFLVALLILGLIGVLVCGIVLMAAGGKANVKYGNKLMVARIWLQALVLIAMVLLFATAKS